MKKNRKEKKYGKLLVISLFIILVSMSAAQALMKNAGNNNLPPTIPLGMDAFFTWEDNFNTMEWIDPDPGMSYNFVVSGGKVRIKNTYEVWTDPDWTKLKPITLNNNAGEPLTDYAIHIVVNHDPDMKDDYGDIMEIGLKDMEWDVEERKVQPCSMADNQPMKWTRAKNAKK